MNCALDDAPKSTKPHDGPVKTHYYVDRQGTRFQQDLCENHAPPRYWHERLPGENPFAVGFLKKKGIKHRWNTAAGRTLTQKQLDFAEELAIKKMRRRFEET